MIPGEYFIQGGEVSANTGRRTAKVKVTNTGDRPIQVGSHFHFFEVNKAMSFDREKAYGMRLNIIASTAVRFEPGEVKEVELVDIGGLRRIFGHNNLVDGDLDVPNNKKRAMDNVEAKHFQNKEIQ
ncbi:MULTISPECIES: urease subunit beta [Chitinophagaceae]